MSTYSSPHVSTVTYVRVVTVTSCAAVAVAQEWLTWMALSSLLGVLMTYSTVLCNSYNSPLATSITGNTKDIISTLIGAYCRLHSVV